MLHDVALRQSAQQSRRFAANQLKHAKIKAHRPQDNIAIDFDL
jgi:hypothetical protein